MSIPFVYKNKFWLNLIFDVVALLVLMIIFYLVFIEKKYDVGSQEMGIVRYVISGTVLLMIVQFFFLIGRLFFIVTKTNWVFSVLLLIHIGIICLMLLGYVFFLLLLSGGIGTAAIN